jgi:hypothetical protein
MPASQPAYFHLQEFSDGGVLLLGGRLYTYAQGTTALKTAYTDPAGAVPQTYTADGLGGQYIALNARGELPAPLYLAAGSYDIALKRADGSTVWTRRADPSGDGIAALLLTFLTSAGALLMGFIQAGVGAVMGSVQDRLRQEFRLWDYLTDAQRADIESGAAIIDCTAALDTARDYAASRRKVIAGYPIGGATIILPPGRIQITEHKRKNGVSMRGEGIYTTVFLMSKNGGTGLRTAAADTQLSADNVYWLRDADWSIIHNPAVSFTLPTTLINMTGMSRYSARNIGVSWGSNVRGVGMTGATPAGSGGPAQWYNSFYDCFVEGDGTGGIGWELGDTDVNKEQITTWNWFGGRTSSNNAIGTGMKLNSATGCSIRGHVFEGCTNQLLVGSPAGTRGCQHNYIEAYFEGSANGYIIYPNALATQIKGFATGVTNVDNGTNTLRLSDGEIKIPVTAATNSFRLMQASPTYKPQIFGSGSPGLRLTNTAASWVDIANNASTSSGSTYVEIANDLGQSLLQIGVAKAQIYPAQFSLGNQSLVSFLIGAGSPEGSVSASPGAICQRTNGGAATSLYVKETGTGNTGWVAK